MDILSMMLLLLDYNKWTKKAQINFRPLLMYKITTRYYQHSLII